MNTPVPFSTLTSLPVRFFWDTALPAPPVVPGGAQGSVTRELEIKNKWTGQVVHIAGITRDVLFHENADFYQDGRAGFEYRHRVKIVIPRYSVSPERIGYSPWTGATQFKVELAVNPGLGGPGGSGLIGIGGGPGQGGTQGGTGTPGGVQPPETVTTNATLAGFSVPVIALALAAFFLLRKKL